MKRYYCKMAQIADYWIETTGKRALLLAFDIGTENDVAVCEKVKSLMTHKDMADIVKHGKNGEIQRAYSVCRKIIGARFHSAVLSLKMNIDFYPIIYTVPLPERTGAGQSQPLPRIYQG